jgi:hypothetical protein
MTSSLQMAGTPVCQMRGLKFKLKYWNLTDGEVK